MSGSVQLRFGNMFDGPSDLIVLPCSTFGTVTDFVDKALRYFNIPKPPAGLSLGDVHIAPFKGGENIASFVAFAVSVDRMTSTPRAINKISQQLGKFTVDHPSVRAIAAPLLGGGSGGLHEKEVVEALRAGFLAQAAPGATLTINILNREEFEVFRDKEESKPVLRKSPPRVFISYTYTNDEHSQWVAGIASFLRGNGIESRLDQWHLRRGMDLPQWMCNELKMADRVLIISNEAYVERADGRHGGVGWETMVIQGDISRLPPESTKYLVVVRCEDCDKGLPHYLKTKYAIHWASSKNESNLRKELLEEIFEVDHVPPIGEPPIFL